MDELYPFLDQNENLYFASEGHLGLGGMDIFVSRRTANGWSEPLNLGTPFNSHYDDFGVYFKNDLKSGFFSSNRPGGDGSDDIYSFEMVFDSPKEKKEALEIFVGKINQSKFENNKGLEIMGEIMDKDSHKPLEDIWVILKDQYKNEVRQAVTDENGKYKFKYLTPGNYIIEFEKKPTNEMSSFKTQPADTVYTFTPEYVQNYKLAEVSLDAQKIGNKNILLGLVTTSGSNKLNDIDIFLVDKSGKIRNHTEVNNEGYFAFKDLKTMEYFIVMKEQIPNLAVTTYLCNIDSNLTISKSEIIKKEEGYDNIFPTYADSVNAIIVGGVNSDISQKVLNNIPIFLASANLKTINSSYSNNGGYFVFTNLKKNNDVIFNEASNRGLLTKHVITLDYNLKNHKVIHSQILDFKKLKGKIEKEEKLVINGKVKSLQNKGIVANKYILVLDSTNNIINRVRSNEEGYFVVNDLSYDNTYKFIFEDYEPLLSVQLNLSYIDLDLQEYYGKLSSYKYAELKGLNKEAQEVNINCKAFYNKDRRPAENVAFFVVGENGKIIKRLTTNKDGAFYFYKKQVGDYYILQESIDTSITVTMNSKRKSYSKLKSNIEIAGSKNFQLFNSVYFGLGNADLNDYAKNVLNSFQNYMKDNNIKKVVLNGYGDLSGSADKNLLITSKRTQTCKDFLDFKGIDHKKIELKALGKTDKFKNENNEYDPALNRKVDILFLE
jgi:outer membrane protein OmpA-like peptidoglycan-associated protein